MREYQFWDELGNIFNAIVAYQHKTIEFNKKFVNPWLRLGTVFDQTDHNADTLLAAQKAIEIDRENGSNWLALGDVYFKMGSFDDAANAYSTAIELNPNLGWAYANLALVNATREEYSKAVNMYVKSLEHIADDKDRSMIWNRLGNAYRKVNDYENAFIAFQMADECDGQNTGFDDQLDEVTIEQKVMPIVAEVYVNNKVKPTTSPEPMVEELSVQLEESAVIEETGEEVETFSEVQREEKTAVSDDEQVDSSDPNYVPDEERPGSISLVADLQDADAVSIADADASDEPVMEQQTEESAAPEASVTDEEAQSESVEEVVAEETQTEIVSEIPAMESEQDEFVTETSVEVPAEDSQLDDATELADEEPVNEDAQPEVASEAPVLEILAEEVQPQDEEDEQDEFVAETSVEVPAEDSQLDDASEPVGEEPVNEEAQPESIEETDAVEAQVEVASETPVLKNLAEEVQSQDNEDEQDEFVAEASIEVSTEDSQLDAVSEPVGENPVNEEAQLESIEETDADEAQIEAASETSDMEIVTDEMQAEDVADDGESDAIAEPSLDISAETASTLDVDYDDAGVINSTLPMPHGAETFANPLAGNQPVVLVVDDLADLFKKSDPAEEVEAESQDIETEAQLEVKVEAIDDVANENVQAESNDDQDEVTDVVKKIVALADANDEAPSAIEDDAASDSAPEMENDQPIAENESTLDADREPAYDAFLEQADEPVLETAETVFAPVDKLKVEPDTKNAHVWNELGNVYFNTGAFEEAVTAYSKAIELDDWFAWPYSNLALVYVQKENYAEAILLYQRSIELFSSDKDKAITWNRLGNVYRRLNDYDNAIACYQRADELDPNNATRSLRSRFSLLGSLSLEESSSVAV